MPKVSSIKYNPNLTVRENAERCGVSEAAIRAYLQKNNIDRRFDKKQNIIADCKKYLKKNPNMTRKELHEKTGYTLVTIRRYWENITTEKELTEINTNKQQKRLLRQDNNFYATHPSIVQDLLGVEDFNKKILEPFCGNGMIAETLKNNGYVVDAYDLIDRGYGKQGDFFKTEFERGEYDIVTNPPYDETLHIITKKCLDICKSKVAFLLPITYLSGLSRYNDLYKPYPPSCVYVYSDRIQIGKNGEFDEIKGNLVVYAWVIWEKFYQGKTVLKWITNTNFTPQKKLAELKARIDNLFAIEKQNEINILKNGAFLPPPTVETLTRWEEYDASKYLCYAFRQKGDKRKGLPIPFGNMNGGFEFDVQDVHFNNSEAAYISGMFSNNTPEHIEVQKQLVANTNGKLAKGDIRHHNQDKARTDWYEFNVQWMLYVVWQKIKGSEEFRNLLMGVPEGATIIEETTFQGVKNVNDTTQFWGARNKDRKEFAELIDDYIKKTKATAGKTQRKKLKADFFTVFTDYGVFKGRNVMGKILTICRQCLQDGTEPPIDYELLKSKHIHLLGKELTF